jgi:arabinogalactan oligomer / maltooligosaccharide transport system substrate-binding protein
MSWSPTLTDLPAARVMALEGRQTPANSAVYSDPQGRPIRMLAAFRQQVETAVPMPNVRPEMTMVWSPATTAMNVIVQGRAKPASALSDAQKDVVERIGKLRPR